MHLTIGRYLSASNDSLGLLFVDEVFACYTLEDEHRDVKVAGETRIPEGKYALGLTKSPKFSALYGHDMIEILGIPNFSKVYFHKGNSEKDTMGCILVGNAVRYNPAGTSWLEDSKKAYDRIYPIVAEAIKAGTVTIDVLDLITT